MGTVAADLFASYTNWATQNGRQSMNSTNFGRELKRLKVPHKRIRKGVEYALQVI